jgi:polysaccharide export outer membrane protein
MKGSFVVFAQVLALTAMCAGVCSAQGRIEPRAVADDVAIGESLSEYTLGKGDVVKIDVRNQPEFTGSFIVGPDGSIQYEFIGDVKAEGLTKEQLQETIVNRLERYVKGPEVSVIIEQYNSKFIYVLGEVHRPGKYPMKGDMVKLREALMASGLPTRDAALRRVHVITPDEIKPIFQKVDIYRLLYQGKLEQNVPLAPGDVVVVPSTVPSEINRALTNLLSPFSKAASSAAIYEQLSD